MNSLSNFTPIVLTWLLTHFAHSSIFFVLTLLCEKLGFLNQRNFAETAWRFVLFGGLLSATLQLPLQTVSMPKLSEKPILNSEREANKDVFQPVVQESVLLIDSSTPVVELHSSHPLTLERPDSSSSSVEQHIIELPAHLREAIGVLTGVWLLYFFFVIAKTCRSVFYLNRVPSKMSAVSKSDLKPLLPKNLSETAAKAIHIYQSKDCSTPFVCPNGAICLPHWVFQELSVAQIQAILAHEIHHIVRRDCYWKIAQQIMIEVFFYQPFSRYIEKKLALLAEIDCDQTAIRASESNTFAESLLRCAEVSINIKHPTFAVSMAKDSTLLRRINLLLDEEYMQNIRNSSPSKTAGRNTIMIALLLSAITFSVPTIAFDLVENVPTALALEKTTESKNKVPLPGNTVSPKLHVTSTSDETKPKAKNPKDNFKKDNTRSDPNQNMKVVDQNVKATEAQKSAISEQTKFEQAHLAYENKEYLQALALYSELANLKHSEAQFMLGKMFWDGRGVNANPEKAKIWFSLASNTGHVKALEYVDLIAEREKRREEINFFTTAFDGGNLKWTEETCIRPKLPTKEAGKKVLESIAQTVTESSKCHSEYALALNQSRTEMLHLPPSLRQIMRAEELEKATQLAKIVYDKSEMQAKMSNDLLVELFDSWKASQKELRNKSDNYLGGLVLGMAMSQKK